VEIPRKREKNSKEKEVECNPHPLGRHNVEVGKCYLAEPRDKTTSLLCCFSLIDFFSRAHSIATWFSLTNTF
jgi:hypothetical protein